MKKSKRISFAVFVLLALLLLVGCTVPQQTIPAEVTSTPEIKPTNTPDVREDYDSVAKITGASDKTGIYSVTVTLKEEAAEKGEIEMIYYGAKGSPQEASVVNTFVIRYNKETTGKYEISTFFDGELYQNFYNKDVVKVVNTFGAQLRAGSVVIYYTPEGKEKTEIFRENAEWFYKE